MRQQLCSILKDKEQQKTSIFQSVILDIHTYCLNTDFCFKNGIVSFSDFDSLIDTYIDIADDESIDNTYNLFTK